MQCVHGYKCACKEYVWERDSPDGWKICKCGHTRNAHAEVDTAPQSM